MICSRCGDALIDGHVVLRASHVHGRLVFCLDCSERFLDWLRSGPAGRHARLRRRVPTTPAAGRLTPDLSNPPAGPAANGSAP